MAVIIKLDFVLLYIKILIFVLIFQLSTNASASIGSYITNHQIAPPDKIKLVKIVVDKEKLGNYRVDFENIMNYPIGSEGNITLIGFNFGNRDGMIVLFEYAEDEWKIMRRQSAIMEIGGIEVMEEVDKSNGCSIMAITTKPRGGSNSYYEFYDLIRACKSGLKNLFHTSFANNFYLGIEGIFQKVIVTKKINDYSDINILKFEKSLLLLEKNQPDTLINLSTTKRYKYRRALDQYTEKLIVCTESYIGWGDGIACVLDDTLGIDFPQTLFSTRGVEIITKEKRIWVDWDKFEGLLHLNKIKFIK